ncbi:hypothetical protein PV328_011480 [Microctonus aethiopoides]|uniref:Regulator of G-protein signaling n=1 Tax=Microctonus aethiopoides TaxID=144406 RepID=A0AA39C4Q1_9HYME|nr:hypothetical protein PV328_011480 [Microctonus aethiopoides]
MHHNRRKKKRTNYGVRAVELSRGTKGFGFTISGQQPCILSCIVGGSPAEIVGLRAGDYLVAVNGHNVGKAPHDDVVRLINNSRGVLRLQIAENYYSDSSDEEGLNASRSKPKYSHKTRNNNTNGQTTTTTITTTTVQSSIALTATTTITEPLQCRIAKVVRDLQTGAMFDGNNISINNNIINDNNNIDDLRAITKSTKLPQSKMQCAQNGNCHRWNLTNTLSMPPPPLSYKRDTEKIVHRTVVGYLGTIDIPNQLHPSTMMQVLRKCIKRLKTEKRNPITVLLTIHVANIKLTNSNNKIIAEYPSYRIVFCNSFSEMDKQYFGIVTKSARDSDNDIVSNSCHVFTIYYKLIDHNVHLSTCNIFDFTCTKTSELNVCQEFPDSCNSLIGAIQTLYITDTTESDSGLAFGDARRHRDTVSPQPSNISTSTAHSSNSDSGIGFKDEYGSQSDRNINIDYQPQQQHQKIYPPSLHPRALLSVSGNNLTNDNSNTNNTTMRLAVRATPDNWLENSRADEIQNDDVLLSNESTNMCLGVDERISGRIESENESRASSSGDGITCPVTSAHNTQPFLPQPPFLNNNNSITEDQDENESVGSLLFARTIAGMFHGVNDEPELLRNIIMMGNNNDDVGDIADDNDEMKMCNKLSPKVFNISKSLVHSLEDLKSDNDSNAVLLNSFTGKSDGGTRPWGSLQEIRNVSGFESDCMLYDSTESCNKTDIGTGVHTWSLGFEKLLKDPKGLQTFAEFLKKEFSHENIYFWAACERYKNNDDATCRRRLAWQIYQRHLSTTANEPVNVDSHAAGQITQELLNHAPVNLFLQAQKQVFNLMKFDSYPRFLRSDLYRHCLETGNVIVNNDDCDLALTNSPSVKLKKSHSDAEDRCRKSILPWNRKNRSKSKDRGETEYNKTPNRGETIYKSFTSIKRDNEGNNNDDNTSISSSRSSLASWDLALRQSFTKHSSASYDGHNEKKEVQTKCSGLCRVILPDGSTTVVPTSQSDCIKDVVNRLLDKRALRYNNYDVLILATDEMVNLKYSSCVLAGQEVEVVPTKVLKVDLPSRRIITVVAHKGRILKDVLRPLLNKYGFKLELITIWGDGHPVSLEIPAINAPTRLVLTSNSDDFHLRCQDEIPQGQTTLDEITNKVFEELLVGKSINKYHSEGSCKSDDQRSESSSILSSKFFTRDTNILTKRKSKSKSSNLSEKSCSTDCTGEENSQSTRSHAPLIAKWRNGVKLQLPGRFDADELYEGLKRAQRSRLEDQRGTEINFELPDFLKNKENGKQNTDEKKIRRGRLTSSLNSDVGSSSKFYDSSTSDDSKKQNKLDKQSNNHRHSAINPYHHHQHQHNHHHHHHYMNNHHDECDKYKKKISTSDVQSNLDSSSSLDCTLEDIDQTIIENDSKLSDNNDDSEKCNDKSVKIISNNSISPIKSLKPPPLPPKPKGLLTSVIKTSQILSTKPIPRSTTHITSDSRENKNIF